MNARLSREVEPPRPPDVWEASWGPREAWERAVVEHAAYWQHHVHPFVVCRQEANCPHCWECGYLRAHPIHQEVV